MPERLSQRLADALRGLADDLAGEPFLAEGRLVEDVEFTGGTAAFVDHGLGRRARGWVEVTPADATARVELAPAHDATTDLTRHVRVMPTNSGACHVWVF